MRLAPRIARQRTVVETLRRRLAFELLVLERLERRAAPSAIDGRRSLAGVLDAARRRRLENPS